MNTRKGFTLVELLVVIAILAILATVSVVGYTAYISETEAKAALSEADEVNGAILTALTLNRQVEATIDGANVIFERDGNSFKVVTGKDASEEVADLQGVKSDLLAKLSVEDDVLVYSYDPADADTYKYNVITNTLIEADEDDE